MLIALSGIDGSGKSTQLARLASSLAEQGKRCHTLWFRPGYSDTLNSARALVRRLRPRALPTAGDSHERTEQLRRPGVSEAWVAMAMLDAMAQYAVKVRYLLATNDAVICDRYVADAVMDLQLHFPGVRLGPAPALLARVSPRPDLAILLMIPWSVTVERLSHKNEPFPDDVSIRRQRYDRYVALAASGRFCAIDGLGSEDEVAARILDLVEARAA